MYYIQKHSVKMSLQEVMLLKLYRNAEVVQQSKESLLSVDIDIKE